ncbi:hypothetical protein M0805_009319 [Coniferiporia weirii]|nr:hypothetical protein M0805_009319 [Coniferiporia weirii]
MLSQSIRVARARRTLYVPRNRGAYVHTDSASSSRGLNCRLSHVALLAGTAAALSYSYAKSRPVLNDAASSAQGQMDELPASSPGLVWDEEHLTTFAWGSNKEHIISPTTPEAVSFRVPSDVPWLKDVALRDLVLHEQHGACVDARGDIYQWNGKSGGPVLSLAGKDIVNVQATGSRIFALSSVGKIYALSSDVKREESATTAGEGSSVWSLFRRGSNTGQNKDYVELGAEQKLGRGEKFVSISAGNDHLLALTSDGRSFAHPLSKNANDYGQLGFRKVTLPPQSGAGGRSGERVTVELVPKAVLDPYMNVSRNQRVKLPALTSSAGSSTSPNSSPITDSQATSPPELEIEGIRFCDRLFEIPSLRGVRVAQAVAGARSSFVRIKSEGRVLAWGANEYGQLGLGSTLTINTITIPTEVVFSKSASSRTRSQCVDVNAGGDLAFFTVERTDGSFISSTDLLACGMGQWGGLGNGLYSTAQGNPARIKAVSGLLEFSEKTQNLQPIVPHAISVSPTGHVLLTLDTLAHTGPGVSQGGGRDLFVWGANREYQLGNGKRASLATPATLELPGLPTEVGDKPGDDSEGGKKSRLMMVQARAKLVKDLQGRRWGTNVDVEQCAVAGWESSLVYWKICRKM